MEALLEREADSTYRQYAKSELPTSLLLCRHYLALKDIVVKG